MADFRNEACRKKQRDEASANKKGIALLEKVWELKDKGKVQRIICNLCRAEKLYIALGRDGFTNLPENCVVLRVPNGLIGSAKTAMATDHV